MGNINWLMGTMEGAVKKYFEDEGYELEQEDLDSYIKDCYENILRYKKMYEGVSVKAGIDLENDVLDIF